MVDDRRVLSCLTLVASIEDRNVTTIEGLSQADGRLHPMQQAFIDHDAFDFAQALMALDAQVEVIGQNGPREFPFAKLHRQPG
jgi:aerobic-type carbon monoxide dehydrogenase small subunit (CoxS/CutS family)